MFGVSGPEEIELIKSAAQEIEGVTCLKFPEYDSSQHEDYITVADAEPGCFSSPGKQGGEQILNLQRSEVWNRDLISSITEFYLVDPFSLVVVWKSSQLFTSYFIVWVGKIEISRIAVNSATLKFVGFFHMQSATDRDEYIEVVWDNIAEENKGNFDKFGADILKSFDVEYGICSIVGFVLCTQAN